MLGCYKIPISVSYYYGYYHLIMIILSRKYPGKVRESQGENTLSLYLDRSGKGKSHVWTDDGKAARAVSYVPQSFFLKLARSLTLVLETQYSHGTRSGRGKL
jgi:hypothetical protein